MCEIDIHSRKLNLEKLATHFQMFQSDFDEDLQHLLSDIERNKYTLLELVTFCKPFSEERFMLSEMALEDGLPKI